MGLPVVMIRGMLEAGKTYFLKDALLRRDFGDLPKILILSQEDGTEEYEKEFLTEVNGVAVYLSQEEWNCNVVTELIRKHKPHVVFIECNEMWTQSEVEYPSYFDVQQVMCIIDSETFPYYFSAMRQLFVDMVKESEVVVLSRATESEQTSKTKKNIKMINATAEIIALDENGAKLSFESDLPYDVNAPVIEIGTSEYGDFYIDTLESEQRYNGKTVLLTCQAFFSKKLPPKTFVAGRFAMTCCADDIQLLGHLASYSGKVSILNESWVKVKAVIHYTTFRGSPEKQIILDVLSVEPTTQLSYEEGLLTLK